ncbi:uncharacterized protein N7500_009424 [Penicillium coprophilum]|uniref:uncharacterized protein n=1 Tax=Penicillium coprophilum TaxID=36646 RepID=UPI00238F433E|nr:uncharacterized protein N7500_009424 [Penicillium coprophilum]KAJ5153985.1 hypothetical protein N7500_009424 [Penicillium coprophilum]
MSKMDKSQELLKEFKEVVRVIIILATPLSINSLSHLIDRELDDIKCRLDQLHSVLSLGSSIYYSEIFFWITTKTKANSRLMDSLEKNIYKLPSEGTQRNKISDDSI